MPFVLCYHYDMKVDFEKTGLVASYLANNTEKLYVTKLFKLLYYIDFIAYAKRGASLTGDIYYKLPYGPVPTCVKSDIDLLSNNHMLEKKVKPQLSRFLKLEEDKDKFGKLVISKLTKVDLDKKLSSFEARLVTSVAKKFQKIGAKQLSEQTHKEKPWMLSVMDSPIDYSLAHELDLHAILPAFT